MALNPRGAPDRAILRTVKVMAECNPTVPILLVTDYNPSGIAIANMFINGTNASQHLRSTYTVGSDRLKWVGLHARHVCGSFKHLAVVELTETEKKAVGPRHCLAHMVY